MSAYLYPIRMGILVFPIIVLLITLPLFIRHYSKYGSVSKWTMFLDYSFIFYLICAYFLTILPLPSIAEVAKFQGPKQQLVPFTFVREFLLHTPFRFNQPTTWLQTLKSPSFLQPAFNFLLTVPFGCFLRYHFKKSWKQALVYTFLLTLSFECIQRSALFGIYPRPYRLFDVDDLMLNTLGGMFGYAVTAKIEKWLPDKERMLKAVEAKAERVSVVRRFSAFCVDVILLVIVSALLPLNAWESWLMTILLVVVLPELIFLKTFGMQLVKLKIQSTSRILSIIFRNILGYGLNFTVLGVLLYALNKTGTAPENQLGTLLLIIEVCIVFFLALLVDVILMTVTRSNLLWYERVSRTQMVNALKKKN
ncbi:MAG: VanZ family protein [Lactobacillales bacterium]|jgi:glycopeptide antibiotics resistance protein|nr:VanZ family protein [Lactobacillales bacterium]